MTGDSREVTRAMAGCSPSCGSASLGDLAAHADGLEGIRRDDVRCGDWVAVKTRNSWYSLLHIGEGRFLASGGWFHQQGLAPAIVTVNGCTWGGTAILPDFVACPGLFLEFGNGVTTTRIREAHLMRGGAALSGATEWSCLVALSLDAVDAGDAHAVTTQRGIASRRN